MPIRISTLLLILLIYQTVRAQNQSSIKCDLPENIDRLPEFAQEEIRAVWRNYVPGDDCKQELIITDDILAVLDMLDNDLERHVYKKSNSSSTEANFNHLITTTSPRHETLITIKPAETKLLINNTLESNESPATTTILPLVIKTSDPALPSANEFIVTDENIDYADFTTTARTKVESNRHVISDKLRQHHAFVESGEQPFAYTGLLPVTVTPEFTSTTKLAFDYAEASDEAVTSRAVRITKVKIPTDYEEFEKQRHTNGYVEHKSKFRSEKADQVLSSEKFFEFQDPPMPFLKGVNRQVARLFKEVMNDPDVVSEQRRQEEIHLLAVSYLNAKQLLAFNTWSSQRRKRIRAREQTLYPLSFKARETLKHLALTPSEQVRRERAMNLHGELRDELKAFAIKLREQRQPEGIEEYER